MVPLFDLKEGEFGEIAEISDHSEQQDKPAHFRERQGKHECTEEDHRHHGHSRGHHQHGHQCHCRGSNTRINDMGLRVGKIITLLQKRGKGPVLVKVDESRIAIGRGMAERIKIKSPN